MYNVYATSNEGNGRVMLIGEYEDITEFTFYCGMFADDVVISIARERELKDSEQYEQIRSSAHRG